jgi:hypothetical protein
MILELTSEEHSLLSTIVKISGDNDVTEWLRQENKYWIFLSLFLMNLLKFKLKWHMKNFKKIAEASGLDKH